MTDRLTELVLGLQRMTENVKLRGDDLEYTQKEERYEHITYLDKLLAMVQRLHSSLIDERRRFVPVEKAPPVQLNPNRHAEEPPMPKFIQQGPRKTAE